MVWILMSEDYEIMGVHKSEKSAAKACDQYNEMSVDKFFFYEMHELEE